MTEDAAGPATSDAVRPPGRKRRPRWRQDLKRAGRQLMRSPATLRIVARVTHRLLTLIAGTQRLDARSSPFDAVLRANHPAIVGLWHGQHLLAPFFRPKDLPFVALLSKNVDAEVNAWVVERFGIGIVRGSGGRIPGKTREKGGARALFALKRRMAEGNGVCMIADISKATAREAGLGIVTLAKLTGRPIVPSAATTSRRRVVRRTWDGTTLPLPFGRMAVVMGDPIFVPRDADAAALEEKRQEVTVAIEAANRKAAALVDGPAPR